MRTLAMLLLLLAALATPAAAQAPTLCGTVSAPCQTTTQVTLSPAAPEPALAPDRTELLATVTYTYSNAGAVGAASNTAIVLRFQSSWAGLAANPGETALDVPVTWTGAPGGTTSTTAEATLFLQCTAFNAGSGTATLTAEAQGNGMLMPSNQTLTLDLACPGDEPAGNGTLRPAGAGPDGTDAPPDEPAPRATPGPAPAALAAAAAGLAVLARRQRRV